MDGQRSVVQARARHPAPEYPATDTRCSEQDCDAGGHVKLGWESGGSPQNLQRAPRPPNHPNRETPSQRAFANKANVPDSPLTRHSAESGLQAGSFPSQRYRAAMRYDPDKTMLGTMLNDPEVVAILEKHAPGITKNPMIGMAKGLSANQALVMGSALLGGQTVVDAIRTDMDQLA